MSKPIEPFRAVAFDLDGTLIDTMPDLAAAVNQMLSLLGAPGLPEHRVRAFVGNGVEQLVLRALTASLGEPPAEPSAALVLFRRLYANALYRQSKVYPGVTHTLQSLSAAGITLCCITNKHSEFAEPLLRQAGLSELFQLTLCADRPEERKPSPQMLLSACAQLGIAPSEMLYVGDSSNDVLAARAARMPVVAVSYGYGNDHAGGEPGPDAVVDKLTDILAVCLPSDIDRPRLEPCATGAT